MASPAVPLNALRAFAAAARHLSFTRAGLELCVTQAAISHQIKGLEARLGVTLFRRSSRGLVLTDEGAALAPSLIGCFNGIDRLFEQFEAGGPKEVLTVGAVGTFVMGALLDRLPAFRAAHPRIDLRLLTNNNKVDPVAEGLDFAIRFGDGAWHGLDAELVATAPLSPLCVPALAGRRQEPADLLRMPLLRSYRSRDWPGWFAAAGVSAAVPLRGPLFDSSLVMVQAALRGEGIALVPPAMFGRECMAGQLVRPFRVEADLGGYWLTRLKSRPFTPAMRAFRDWLLS